MNFLMVICSFAVLGACAFAAPSDEKEAILQKLAEIKKTCVAEHPVTDEEITKVKSKDFENVSENFECYTKCFMEHLGTLKDGVVDIEKVVSLKLKKHPETDAKLAKEHAEECLKLHATIKDCKEAFASYKCFEEKF